MNKFIELLDPLRALGRFRALVTVFVRLFDVHRGRQVDVVFFEFLEELR